LYSVCLTNEVHHLCSRVSRSEIGLKDYLVLESSLLHELDLAFFEDRYLVAGAAGQRVLEAMARAGGGRSMPLRSLKTCRTPLSKPWGERGHEGASADRREATRPT